jgi:hypothetical protein
MREHGGMVDELRSEKRAAWQASTPLAQRWMMAGVAFVAAVIVLVLIAVL